MCSRYKGVDQAKLEKAAKTIQAKYRDKKAKNTPEAKAQAAQAKTQTAALKKIAIAAKKERQKLAADKLTGPAVPKFTQVERQSPAVEKLTPPAVPTIAEPPSASGNTPPQEEFITKVTEILPLYSEFFAISPSINELTAVQLGQILANLRYVDSSLFEGVAKKSWSRKQDSDEKAIKDKVSEWVRFKSQWTKLVSTLGVSTTADISETILRQAAIEKFNLVEKSALDARVAQEVAKQTTKLTAGSSALSETIESNKLRLVTLENDNKKLEAENKNLREYSSSVDKTYNSKAAELEISKKQNVELQSKVAKLEADLVKASADLIKAKTEQTAANQTIAQLNSDVASREQLIATVKPVIRTIATSIATVDKATQVVFAGLFTEPFNYDGLVSPLLLTAAEKQALQAGVTRLATTRESALKTYTDTLAAVEANNGTIASQEAVIARAGAQQKNSARKALISIVHDAAQKVGAAANNIKPFDIEKYIALKKIELEYVKKAYETEKARSANKSGSAEAELVIKAIKEAAEIVVAHKARYPEQVAAIKAIATELKAAAQAMVPQTTGRNQKALSDALEAVGNKLD